MPTRGAARKLSSRFFLGPKGYLDRIIFSCQEIDTQSDIPGYLSYLEGRQALFSYGDGTRRTPYFAVSEEKDRAYKQAEIKRYHVRLRRAIPLISEQDKVALEQCITTVNVGSIFHFPAEKQELGGEGWVYVICNESECLYVGLTTNPYPVARVNDHLVGKGESDFARFCQSSRHCFQTWTVRVVTPIDCEPLIKKSFFLPGENHTQIMEEIQEDYHHKIQSDPSWRLRRAESVMIALYDPKFNRKGKQLKD